MFWKATGVNNPKAVLKAQLPEVASETPRPRRRRGNSSGGYIYEAGLQVGA